MLVMQCRRFVNLDNLHRRFYIMTHDGCPLDNGWLSVVDVMVNFRCSQETGTPPLFFYTNIGTKQLYPSKTSP